MGINKNIYGCILVGINWNGRRLDRLAGWGAGNLGMLKSEEPIT